METKYKKLGGLWIPQKEKDEISGKLVQIIPTMGEYNSKGYVIETETEFRTVPGSTVLDNKMSVPFIAVGDFIKIVFLGTHEGKKDYKDFDVYKGAI